VLQWGFLDVGVLIVKSEQHVFFLGLSLDALVVKVLLDVAVGITGLGSSVDTGSGAVSSTGGAGKGSIVCVKTVSNKKVFLLKVLLVSKWKWKLCLVPSNSLRADGEDFF
nr:hypothetical protein [Tanacetum cinerariifolium]